MMLRMRSRGGMKLGALDCVAALDYEAGEAELGRIEMSCEIWGHILPSHTLQDELFVCWVQLC